MLEYESKEIFSTFDIPLVKNTLILRGEDVKEKVKGDVGDVLQSITNELNEFAKKWSIEIRQTTEDGKEVKVLEFGTKKDEPPETPE